MNNETREEWEQVLKEEEQYINAYRDKNGRTNSKQLPPDNTVGLAFSGGGIRSATFGLGVLEALKERGLLKNIDYLSTVSGGGYIGSWLSANCLRTAQRQKKCNANPEDEEPDWLDENANWKDSVDHLRQYSNYLSPKLGFFSADTWSIATIWLRNTLLIQLMIILTITCLLILPHLFYGFFNDYSWQILNWISIIFYILASVGISANLLGMNQPDSFFLQIENWWYGVIASIACLSVAVLIIFFFDYAQIKGYAAFFFMAASFFLLPTAIKIINIMRPEIHNIAQISYSQPHVQKFVVLPILAACILFSMILGKLILSMKFTHSSFAELFLDAWQIWPTSVVAAFSSLWLFSICSIRTYNRKGWAIALLAPLPAVIVLYSLLSGIVWLFSDPTQYNVQSLILTAPLLLFAFSATIVMLIGMLGRESTDGVREWWGRFAAWVAIYGFCWMIVVFVSYYGPLWMDQFLQSKYLSTGVSVSWLATTVAGLFAAQSGSTDGSPSQGMSTKLKELIVKISPFVFIAGLLFAISIVISRILGPISLNDKNILLIFIVLSLSILCFVVLSYRVDINEFSLNAFYRNRLVRCYLGATRFQPGERHAQKFTGLDDHDDLRMADLTYDSENKNSLKGPLHIVNCALNLGGSSDLSLHTRHSAIFTLTPLRCGSSFLSCNQTGIRKEIGYTTTSRFGGKDGQPTLGQAISVSGAAASPNMGYHTSPSVAFLMTLFNVRLGWWFPNPAKTKLKQRPSPASSLEYLLKELCGVANDKSNYLAISDGGHYENLAAYELVKRKCKVIIVSDGECDPKLQFEGLGKLIRMCKVDFDVTIDIDVSSVRQQEDNPWSSKRCAVGKIIYPDDSEVDGWLIYLKASMNGFEDTAVMQYKDAHPSFPHETTADQFYAEDQFESYRVLGHEVTNGVFEPVEGISGFKAKAQKLNEMFAPGLPDMGKFSDHANTLMNLWSELSQYSGLDILDKELTDSWPKEKPPTFRTAFYLCSEMIQLMESVYLDLNLEETWDHPDNIGWHTLFEQWAGSNHMQQTWALTKENYGLRFRFFWKRKLKPDNTLHS